MALTKEQIQEIVTTHGKDDKDSGATEVQIALISRRISKLTDHFRKHAKDNNSRRGLYRLVGKRRRLLKYLRERTPDRYHDVIEKLELRK